MSSALPNPADSDAQSLHETAHRAFLPLDARDADSAATGRLLRTEPSALLTQHLEETIDAPKPPSLPPPADDCEDTQPYRCRVPTFFETRIPHSADWPLPVTCGHMRTLAYESLEDTLSLRPVPAAVCRETAAGHTAPVPRPGIGVPTRRAGAVVAILCAILPLLGGCWYAADVSVFFCVFVGWAMWRLSGAASIGLLCATCSACDPLTSEPPQRIGQDTFVVSCERGAHPEVVTLFEQAIVCCRKGPAK